MTSQLPNTVQLGDSVSIQPDVLTHGASAEVMPKDLVGTVISIPPHRRFAVVRYNRRGECFRESVPIAPPEERIARKEEEPPKRSGRPRKTSQTEPEEKQPKIIDQIRAKDWSDKTSRQIAEELGRNVSSVESAIHRYETRNHKTIPRRKITYAKRGNPPPET